MTQTLTLTFGPNATPIDVGNMVTLAQDLPLQLDSGAQLHDVPVAYQSYGTLNSAKDNAILICHALTADQYVVGPHPVTGKDGWWEHVVGSGKLIDTDKYFVLCSNVLGSCMGTLGPKSTNPDTGKPYGLDFPVITIADMVRLQAMLLDHFGIEKLHAVIGGSMGGMQVLQWARSYPERLNAVVAIATAPRHSAQNIAFHEIARQAIMVDPNWCEGKYHDAGLFPDRGLSVARMTAHITYLSESAMHRKFGRRLQDRDDVSYGFEADFQVESYLRHQAQSFVQRFDPNAYLYITRAMDYFDLPATAEGGLREAFVGGDVRYCIITFSSDWLYPPSESRAVLQALNGSAADVSFVEVETDKGHDAFLLQEPAFLDMLGGFMKGLECE